MTSPSTLIPLGNHPFTENETDAEVGIRAALSWIFRCDVRCADCGLGWDVDGMAVEVEAD